MRKMHARQRVFEATLLLTLMAAAAGCGRIETTIYTEGQAASTHTGDYPYKIVTTCGMVTDIVEQVAGDKASTTGLMGEGVDPHMYKPTRDDVQQVLDADVVFYSGLMLEGRMGDTFIQVARTGKMVFAVTEGIDESFLREPPEFEGHWDPHVWMDVIAWSECVAFIAETLSQYDQTNAEYYRQNAERYRAELKELHEYAKQAIASVPEQQRVLVTAHDAFGYFTRAYDIEVKAPQGITTESTPAVDDINRLVDYIVEKSVGSIFVESSVNPKSIQSIIEGARSKGHTVVIGGELYSDAMGPPGTYEGTYIGMIDHNATIIARALGGKAPERGLHGKLSL